MSGGETKVHRFRAGAYSVTSTVSSLFLLGFGAFCVVGSLATGSDARTLVPMGAIAAAVGVMTVPWWLAGLAAIRVVPGEDGTISVPECGWRHGYRRTVWPLRELFIVELVPVRGTRLNNRYQVRVAGARDELRSDSLTCSIRRPHPDRSRAGRAVAEIRALVDYAHGF